MANSGDGTGSGIAADGSGLDNPNDPAGLGSDQQAAFIRRLGSFSQSITFSAAGTYTIGFQAAYRYAHLGMNFGGADPFQVELTQGGTTISLGAFTPTSYLTYQSYLVSFNVSAAGTYTITFAGQSPCDRTSFIDNVWIVAGTAVSATATTVYGYDIHGNLQYVTNALGRGPDNPIASTDYTYDSDGRQLTVTQPSLDGTTQNWPTTYYHYDTNGNVDGIEDARGVAPSNLANLATFDPAHTTKYVYDEANRKIEQILPDPNGGSNTLVTSYFYDASSNLTAVRTPASTA